MSVALFKTNRVTEEINLGINKWLAAGLTAAQISTALTNAATAVTAAAPVAGHDDRIKDTGSALNATQPRNI